MLLVKVKISIVVKLLKGIGLQFNVSLGFGVSGISCVGSIV